MLTAYNQKILSRTPSWAPVAHACNLGYSRGRDQEDHGSKPDWANSSRDPILKITLHTHAHTHTHNRAGGVAQGEGPEYKSQYQKKKKYNS
jgi:hypothetical protein